VISVIINCHNCHEFLAEALESVLQQSENDWEIIFWDNASEKPAEAFVKAYGDERIHYFYDQEFVALGEARNRALQHARGEYLAFLDSDDYWRPEKLARQLALFTDAPSVGLVYSDANIVYKGEITKQVFSRMTPPEGEVFGELLGSYFLVMSSVMIRRSALDKLVVWFDPRFEIIEEYDLFLRISADWKFRCVSEVLVDWRWHEGSTTMQKRRLISIEKRLLLKQLNNAYPVLMRQQCAAEKRVKGKILISLALSQYNAGNPKQARRILNKSHSYTSKGIFVYCATFFSVRLIEFFYRKIKGNPLV